eukprot:1096420-Rhodomonas_salina.1
MQCFLHEEVLSKVAGGEALTKSLPVYGVCVAFQSNHLMDREDLWPVLLLSYWDCPGFDSNYELDIANFVDVPQFVNTVWTQSKEFADEPDMWEELLHHKLNLMLNQGPHTIPIYVTCTWCTRCYMGMPEMQPWSYVQAQSDSGAETERVNESASASQECEW